MNPSIRRGANKPMPMMHPAAYQSVKPSSPRLQKMGAPPSHPQAQGVRPQPKLIPKKQVPDAGIEQFTDVTNLGADNFATSVKLLVLALVIFIAFHLWSDSLHSFMKQKIYGGKEIGWKSYLVYSIILTLIIIFILYMVVP